MPGIVSRVAKVICEFVRGPELPQETRHTYVRHLAFVILTAVAMGILSNMPVMAVKRMAPANWQLTLRIVFSGGGQLFVLYLGGWMATLPKMPFVVAPGLAFAACSVAMIGLTGNVFGFLAVLGIGLFFETLSRPAIAAVIRMNYPATCRGSAVGELRKWSSLVYLLATLLSSVAFDRAKDHPLLMARSQLLLAGVLSAAGFWVFATIRVREIPDGADRTIRPNVGRQFADAWRIVATDARFRQYLIGSFLYCVGALTYPMLMEPFVAKDLGFGYIGTAVLVNVLPALLAFLTTGAWGRWFDRVNPWYAWAWIRTGWGLNALILAAAPLLAGRFPAAAWALPFAARVVFGVVMGASWVLWWQIGANHFAPPGGDTTRYMGILIFLNGITRIVAPLAGAWVATRYSRAAALGIGGAIVMVSAAHSAWQAWRERQDARLATMADFEEQFAHSGKSVDKSAGYP